MPFIRFVNEQLLVLAPQGPYLPLFLAFLAAGALCLWYAAALRKSLLPGMLTHAAGGLVALWAGDLLTLLLGWELMTFSAFFILTRPRSARNRHAALRYVRYQIPAAAALFTVMVIQQTATGSLAVTTVVPTAQPFLLLAIALKTAAIPLHGWLVDGYSAAPYPAAPLLSMFATKVGILTAARLLELPATVYLGAFTAVAGAVAALYQTRGTRVLAYHVISQAGFMLAGVGLATELGIQAGLFHAVHSIAYKTLLFMVMGTVILHVGHDRLQELGGLARKLPGTFAAALIAAAAITGLPPFNGFTSKVLLGAATGETPGIKWLLTLAAVGTALSFIQLLYVIFMRPAGKQPGLRRRRLPLPMACAMGTLAAYCIVSGLVPSWIMPGATFRYYSVNSVVAAYIPPAAALLLWALFRARLTAGLQHTVPAAPHGWILRSLRALRSGMRHTQALAWQSCLGAVLLVWMLFLLLFHI